MAEQLVIVLHDAASPSLRPTKMYIAFLLDQNPAGLLIFGCC
jgi:hypothetical protein